MMIGMTIWGLLDVIEIFMILMLTIEIRMIQRSEFVGDPISTSAWHGTLQVSKTILYGTAVDLIGKIVELLLDIEPCDFRVHEYIFKQTIATAENDRCKVCSSNAAFQTAICYSFGFGVRANFEREQDWLLRSERDAKDLEIALESLRRTKTESTKMGLLIDLGYESHLGDDYANHGILDRALIEYKAIVASREKVLGKTHFSSRRMRTLLSGLLDQCGYLDSAAEMIMNEIQITNSIDATKTEDISILKSKLARVYEKMGKYSESKSLRLEVLDEYSNESDTSKASRVVALYDLSSSSLMQGQNEEAAKRALIAIENSMKLLGPDHANTLLAQSILALAYSRLGMLHDAVKLTECVAQNRERLLGLCNSNTIESKALLGQLYFYLQRWEEARDIFRTVMNAREKIFGKTATTTIIAASNFASALARTGKTEEAASIQEEIFDKLKRTLGEEDEQTVDVMSELAVTYQFQRAWDKAEPLEMRVLDYRRCHPNNSHNKILIALRNLSDTQFNQGKWSQAAELSLEELEIRRALSKSLDEPDSEQIKAVTTAARALTYIEKWSDAITQLDREISWRKKTGTDIQMDIMEAFALAASANFKLGQLEAARTRVVEFLEASLKLNSAKISITGMIHDLAVSCESRSWLAEAEQLFVLELLIRNQICPEDQEGLERAEKGALRLLEQQGKPKGSVAFDLTNIKSKKPIKEA